MLWHTPILRNLSHSLQPRRENLIIAANCRVQSHRTIVTNGSSRTGLFHDLPSPRLKSRSLLSQLKCPKRTKNLLGGPSASSLVDRRAWTEQPWTWRSSLAFRTQDGARKGESQKMAPLTHAIFSKNWKAQITQIELVRTFSTPTQP